MNTRFPLPLLFFILSHLILAGTPDDTTKYLTEKNIFYYDKSSSSYQDSICRLDIYYPRDAEDFSTLVWFHGGGLTSGSRSIPAELMNNNIAVITVDYRLNPAVNCPAYIEDAAAAVKWVFNNIESYGGSKKKIFLSGHSAGGFLVMMVGLDKKWLAKYDIDVNEIAGIIPVSGQTITHFTIRKEKGIPETSPVIDEFAPLFHIRKDAPPLILITGDRELELLGRYEENAYLSRMMKLTGHKNTTLYELDGFDHVEMLKPSYSILLKYIQKSEK